MPLKAVSLWLQEVRFFLKDGSNTCTQKYKMIYLTWPRYARFTLCRNFIFKLIFDLWDFEVWNWAEYHLWQQINRKGEWLMSLDHRKTTRSPCVTGPHGESRLSSVPERCQPVLTNWVEEDTENHFRWYILAPNCGPAFSHNAWEVY